MITSETGSTGLEYLQGYRRLMAEDARHEEWLDEAWKRDLLPRAAICKRGHLIDGTKAGPNGNPVRYCRICQRRRVREAARAKARAARIADTL